MSLDERPSAVDSPGILQSTAGDLGRLRVGSHGIHDQQRDYDERRNRDERHAEGAQFEAGARREQGVIQVNRPAYEGHVGS